MTYTNIADMYDSGSLRRRLNAAAAQEHKPIPIDVWVNTNLWKIVSSPGWETKWEEALDHGCSDPGERDDVITDGMILATVQPIT